jgi:hypothetical protein
MMDGVLHGTHRRLGHVLPMQIDSH